VINTPGLDISEKRGKKKILARAGILNPDHPTHKWFNKIHDM